MPVYRRDFRDGIVLVNPSPTATYTVTLDKAYRPLSCQGGGGLVATQISASNTYLNSVGFCSAETRQNLFRWRLPPTNLAQGSTLSIGPQSAVIRLNP